MAKKNWLKDDVEDLKNSLRLPAGIALVALSPLIMRFGERGWAGLSVPAYMIGSVLLAEGAWRGSKRLETLLGRRRRFSRPLLTFAALVFTALCGVLMKPEGVEFVWSIAVLWLPPAIAFLFSIWDFLPSFENPPWSGAALLKLEKKTAKAGETVTAVLVLHRPCRNLAARLELCDGTNPGEDFVFTNHPAEISPLSMKAGKWIATVTARLPDDAPASLDPDEDDEEAGEGRFWELWVEGAEENGAPVEASARVEVR